MLINLNIQINIKWKHFEILLHIVQMTHQQLWNGRKICWIRPGRLIQIRQGSLLRGNDRSCWAHRSFLRCETGHVPVLGRQKSSIAVCWPMSCLFDFPKRKSFFEIFILRGCAALNLQVRASKIRKPPHHRNWRLRPMCSAIKQDQQLNCGSSCVKLQAWRTYSHKIELELIIEDLMPNQKKYVIKIR